MNYNRIGFPTRTNDNRNSRNELMRYANHETVLRHIKAQLNLYYSKSNQWMYDYRDVPKYMLLDHLDLLKRLNLHAEKMDSKVNENLNRIFNS